LLRREGLHDLLAAIVPEEASHVGHSALRVAVTVRKEELPQDVRKVMIRVEGEHLQRIIGAELPLFILAQEDLLIAVQIEVLCVRAVVGSFGSDDMYVLFAVLVEPANTMVE
jgi:hypothetical protein